MNILFISSEYPPETGFGGIGTYTRVMAQALFERGHQVEVIARSETGEPYSRTDGGVVVHRVSPGVFPLPQGRFYFRYRQLCTKFLYHSLVRLAFADSAYRKCLALSATKRFDIIECAECGAEGHYLKPAGSARLIVRLHTPFSYIARLDHLGLGYFNLRKLERLERGLTRRANGISSPTTALKRILGPKWGLKGVTCYPNPMDAAEYAPKTGKGDYIIYTGRVEYRKGVHVLLKAYAQLVKDGVTLPLLIVGSPFGILKKLLPYERLIEELIVKLGITEKVRWIKAAGREEIRRHLQGAAVAVYPSLWENFPYACLEAMASGVPVVASRCGGFEEMIAHKETGLLFDALSHQRLYEALGGLLADEGMASRLGAAGREKVLSAYSPMAVAETAERFYEGILHGR